MTKIPKDESMERTKHNTPKFFLKNSIGAYHPLKIIRRLTFWHSPKENWQFSVTAQKNWRETTETENQFHYTES